MKVNVYFLIAGILSVLFCFTHAWNGSAVVLPAVDGSNLELTVKTAFFYVWHIISAENLVFGIAFLIMAFYKDGAEVKFAAWLMAVIIIARWVIIFGSILLKDMSELKNLPADSIAMTVYVALIMLGIRRINRITGKSNN